MRAISGFFLLFFVYVACCVAAGGSYTLLGWNDLGMHCMDGDYAVYTILPPYNTIHAQLVDPAGKLVRNPAGLTVTYEAIADASGSINTTSAGKTNFWTFVKAIFGSALPIDTGLTGSQMPGPQNTPQSMAWESSQNWFSAVGIPLTPFDDKGDKNYYSMMHLVARDSTGKVLASTDIVLPVSDEMDCSTCHASGSNSIAKPKSGWVNQPLIERDFKLNILLKHDDLHNGAPTYQNALAATGYNTRGLYPTVVSDGQPVLCAACHASNALGAAGQPGVPQLTTSMHAFHAGQTDPVTGTTLDDSADRSACYRCHPGAETRCLRGAMGNSVASDGTLAIQCQSCHGTMSAVGDASRQAWLNEPGCQSCHTGTAVKNAGNIRFTSALDASGALRLAADPTFATQNDVPAAGLSLYRFSAGHGGLACEACHGSTHAEYPSSHANDNVQSIALQGHVGTVAECGTCHTTPPGNSGPHGMHPVGSAWLSQHQSAARNATQCQACHGTDYRGTVLSRAFASRTLNAFGGVNVWRGFQIGCYTCHQGPSNDNRSSNGAPTVSAASIAPSSGKPASVSISATDPNKDALSFWIVSQPANGTVGLNGTNATYLPQPGFEGSDSFTVAAWDGQTSSNLATVQVKVTAAARPQFSAAALLSAASSQSGPIAPGELLTIYGTGIGPATPAGMFVNSAGMVNRSLAGTRVLFDGAAAPVLYASAGQVNVVAPWSLAGKASTSVQVEYGGITSNPVQISVGAAAPAIFPGAVINQDGSVNSASNPATRGSIVTIYATGGGAMDTPAMDGEFSAAPLAKPVNPLSVQIGGVDAPVSYAGDAPGLVSGALQINVQVPSGTPAGNAIPLALKIAGVTAPGVNVSVK